MPRRKVTNRTYSTQTCLFLENRLIVKKLVETAKGEENNIAKISLAGYLFFLIKTNFSAPFKIRLEHQYLMADEHLDKPLLVDPRK